jgi:hypothetical protein
MATAFVRIRGVSALVYDSHNKRLTVLLPDARQTRPATSKLDPKPILPTHYGVLFLPLIVDTTTFKWTEDGDANKFLARVAGVVPDPYDPLKSTDRYALIELEHADLAFPEATGGVSDFGKLTLAPVNGTLNRECEMPAPDVTKVPLLGRAIFTGGTVHKDASGPKCWRMLDPTDGTGQAVPVNYDLGARVEWAFRDTLSVEIKPFGGKVAKLEVSTSADVPLLLRNLEFPFLINEKLPGPNSKDPDRDFERLYDLSNKDKSILIPHEDKCPTALLAAGGGRAARCMLGVF